jgi:hypothetical protein
MPLSFADVDAFARSLPAVTVDLQWRHKTWMVNGRGFAWQRAFSKADLARFGDEKPPAGEILAVRVENLDAKDALLAIAPRGFFTIPHFNGFPAVLIALAQARADDVRAAVRGAHTAMAAAPAKKKRPAKRKRPAAKRRRKA